MDSLINYGGEIKALGDGKVGGYGVTFGGKDSYGEWFTAKTYYGKHSGDGVDIMFHHGMPAKGYDKAFVDYIFGSAAKAKIDENGIFVETEFDLSNALEKKTYDDVLAGKLGWSSGAPVHAVKRLDSGEITRWFISEFSLTPKPADARNRIVPMKSLLDAEAKSTGLSFDDKRSLITRALCSRSAEGMGNSAEYCDLWVCDLYDTSVVYCEGAKMYECSYSTEGEEVTLGTPKEVRRVVTYRPMKTIREYEDHLRDLGYTHSQAVALASGGYKAAFPLRDSESEQEAAKSLAMQLTVDRLLFDNALLALSQY